MSRPAFLSIVREAIASARAQRVTSALTVLMIAGMCLTILLTTGRAAGAQERILSSIDEAALRTVVVRAPPEARLESDVVDHLSRVDGIEWAGAFGAAVDATNTRIPGGTLTPTRTLWTHDLQALGITPQGLPSLHTAWVSERAARQLGMPTGHGAVATVGGGDYAVAGTFEVPEYLDFLEPLVVVPREPAGAAAPAPEEAVSVVVVVVEEVGLLRASVSALRSLVHVEQGTSVTISTSEKLAQLRSIIDGQFGDFSRNLVYGVTAVTAALVAAILHGLVLLRRRDFGRRRALGASQHLIVLLLVVQTSILSICAACIGSVIAAALLLFWGDPLPGAEFFAAVIVLATITGLLAAMVPAVFAARRDPLRELRVP